ncbi:MAG: GNAT family N-acetyltransferase [Methanomassiliicoccus sp.]|nr:GNAT family N-acetyltransferase [Methanomassiliicoccus sp.]
MRATIVTSVEELVELEERWEALRRECGGTLFASNYLTRAWFQVYARIATPKVVVVERNHELVGIAPLTSYGYRIAGLPIKVLALAGEMKGRLRLSTTSPMYRPDCSDSLSMMIDKIKSMDWGLLTTINLDSNNANQRYVDAVRSVWRTEEYPVAKKMTVSLPGSGSIADTFDKKTRKNLEYRERLLEREGHDVMYRRVPSDGIDAAVETYARQHIERWEDKGGSYFQDLDNVRFMKVCSTLSHHAGRGHVYEMLIDGEVAAQDFYMVDGTIAYGDKTGMNNRFMRYSPGWLVQTHALDDLRDRGMESCVMGVGGEKYKSEMKGEESPLIGIRATRGGAAFFSRLRNTPIGKHLDRRLGVSN